MDALQGRQELSAADLDALPFTQAVLQETLRLFAPAPFTLREAKEACDLGGFSVPAGTTIGVATYSLHRDERYWPRAGEFLPQRWLKVGLGHLVTASMLGMVSGCGAAPKLVRCSVWFAVSAADQPAGHCYLGKHTGLRRG